MPEKCRKYHKICQTSFAAHFRSIQDKCDLQLSENVNLQRYITGHFTAEKPLLLWSPRVVTPTIIVKHIRKWGLIASVKAYLAELKYLGRLSVVSRHFKSSFPLEEGSFFWITEKMPYFYLLSSCHHPGLHPRHIPLIWQHPQDNSHTSSLKSRDSGTLSEFAVHWKRYKEGRK